MSPLIRAIENFWNKVEFNLDGCWIWKPNPDGGYGQIRRGRKRERAHRVAYEMLRGPIPPGMVLDHLCRNTRCVRPSHLEPVTVAENNRRGLAGPRSECANGHPYDENNTLIDPRGMKRCRQCRRERNRLARKNEAARRRGASEHDVVTALQAGK